MGHVADLTGQTQGLHFPPQAFLRKSQTIDQRDEKAND